jgi:hypothetical protein
MPPIYEIYYENKSGDVVFCSDHITSEMEARDELRQLKVEFPEYDYWYEAIYEDEQ